MEDRSGSVHVVLLLLLLIALELRVLTRASSSACHYGVQNCGNASVPYPFGMQDGCGLPNYRILCKENASFGAGEFPFLQLPSNDSGKIHEFQVLSFNTSSLIINVTHVRATDSCNPAYSNHSKFSIASDMPFAVSPTNNIFTAIGCSFHGQFSTAADSFSGGYSQCITSCYVCQIQPCYNQSDLYSFCSPPGCCMIALYTVPAKRVEMKATENNPAGNPHCGFAAIFDPDTYKTADNHTWGFPNGQYGLNLIWGLPLDGYSQSCSTVKGTPAYACSASADCLNVTSLPGYVCNCSRTGYGGDGYLNGTGCKDIDECTEGTDYNCVTSPYGLCINTDGGYECSCKKGAKGDGTENGTRCTKNTISATVIIPVSVLSTAAAIAITGFSALWIYKARASKIRKAKYFARNGGIRFQEYISAASEEAPRLYSEAELQKATRNFAQDLQLGRGGYGTVYKGILSDHTTVVAVKKSNHTIVEDQEIVDQFINEIIILSQINHRNIVKLLGCCLETAVPLLVYEYISNGTLFEHLHGKDGRFLSWESRLAIALESAQALAYLHSYASAPIFHRDIKSSNILLDVALTAKVSDFGISRLLPMGDTHVSTVVHGTMGYLDPEYFQTLQLTAKSDVFSFGVVLLELITSLTPLAMERGEEDSSLAMLCISRWTAGTFATLIDPGLRASENPHLLQSINKVAKLAITCLHAEGSKRPSMKEVFEILLWIRGSKGAFVQAHIHSSQDFYDGEAGAERPLIPSSQKKASSSDHQSGLPNSNPSGRLLGLEMAMVNDLKMKGGR